MLEVHLYQDFIVKEHLEMLLLDPFFEPFSYIFFFASFPHFSLSALLSVFMVDFAFASEHTSKQTVGLFGQRACVP